MSTKSIAAFLTNRRYIAIKACIIFMIIYIIHLRFPVYTWNVNDKYITQWNGWSESSIKMFIGNPSSEVNKAVYPGIILPIRRAKSPDIKKTLIYKNFENGFLYVWMIRDKKCLVVYEAEWYTKTIDGCLK